MFFECVFYCVVIKTGDMYHFKIKILIRLSGKINIFKSILRAPVASDRASEVIRQCLGTRDDSQVGLTLSSSGRLSMPETAGGPQPYWHSD